MAEEFLYDVRLPEAPYQFVWSAVAAVDCQVSDTPHYAQRRYVHADGSDVIIRHYRVDGSWRVLTNRGEIKVIDNAANPDAADAISVVCLP